MQKWCEDYYEICETGEGCCLNCYNAREGCLCYYCKCKKCFWYNLLPDGSGECEKKFELIKERKESARLKYQLQEEKEKKKSEALEEENEKVLKIIKEKKEIPNYYSCQVCKRDFVTEKEEVIIPNHNPKCPICSNKIKVEVKEKIW